MMCIAIIGHFIYGSTFAVSAMIGASLAIAPQVIFGYWVFKERGARNANSIVRNFFVGEALKLGITVVLFAIIWTSTQGLNTVAILISFIITILFGQLSLPLLAIETRTK